MKSFILTTDAHTVWLRRDPLRIHAENVLITGKLSSKSWFWLIREICLQYELPHPLSILNNPLSKLYNYMDITQPHPIWSTVGSNPHEISKAIQFLAATKA